jgi:RNA polymerase sigma factor (sigma-70 family)
MLTKLKKAQMVENSDKALLAYFREGKQKAFDVIYNTFFNRLFVFAVGLVRSEGDAEEIVLDSMSALFRKHRDFETIPNIRAFLYVSTRNSCFNLLKFRQRKQLKITELDDNLKDESYLEIGQIEGELLQIKAVYKAISSLPDRCKIIMEMLYLEGLKVETISDKLNISVQTVYSQKNRAINLLKQSLSLCVYSCISLLPLTSGKIASLLFYS